MYAPLCIVRRAGQTCWFLACARRKGAYIPAKNAGTYAPPAFLWYVYRIMLKRWSIFGMLLVVFCAHGRADKVQNNGRQQSQAQSSPTSRGDHQQVTGQYSPQEHENDIQADVKIINPPEKDFYDKAPFWLNLALTIAGFIGIGIAVWTVRTIKRQVDTFVSKERARLTVDIRQFEPSYGGIWIARVKIANHGSTNAFIGPALCSACVKDPGWQGKMAITTQIPLPKVIPANGEPEEYAARIEMPGPSVYEVDQATFEAVRGGVKRIYVVGLIEFWDVFGARWTLKFFRLWWGTWLDSKWQYTAWRDYLPEDGAPADANGELRIEKPSAIRRFLRRMMRRDPNAVLARKEN